MAWRLVAWCGALLFLAGCSGPIDVYHDIEGGAIAQHRQAPPGADLPYPNLAAVPQLPAVLSPAQQATVGARIAGAPAGGVSAASPGALAGLRLPEAPPPVPAIPGLVEQAPHRAAPAPAAAAPAVVVPPPGAPVALAFAPGSAVLDHDTAVALAGIVAGLGDANLLVGGFGEAVAPGDGAAMLLALARAQRLADALTADGVAPYRIRLEAAATGSGGFVQLLY
jgi:hypothetical protein